MTSFGETPDPDMLKLVPEALAELLRTRGGFIVHGGGLHVRGACSEPWWHSLRAAWEGDDAFHRLYPAVQADDVPFAEDCMGDQLLLRGGAVLRLLAETGDLREVAPSLDEFLASVERDPVAALQMDPLLQFESEGHRLLPGQLLGASPPFSMAASGERVDLRAIPSRERRLFLADVARQLVGVPDGSPVQLEVEGPKAGRPTTACS